MKRLSAKTIQEALDDFDFFRMQRATEAWSWKWAGCEGVPGVEDIRANARRMLGELSWDGGSEESGTVAIRTGGLGAYLEFDEGEVVGARLALEAVESEAWAAASRLASVFV